MSVRTPSTQRVGSRALPVASLAATTQRSTTKARTAATCSDLPLASARRVLVRRVLPGVSRSSMRHALRKMDLSPERNQVCTEGGAPVVTMPPLDLAGGPLRRSTIKLTVSARGPREDDSSSVQRRRRSAAASARRAAQPRARQREGRRRPAPARWRPPRSSAALLGCPAVLFLPATAASSECRSRSRYVALLREPRLSRRKRRRRGGAARHGAPSVAAASLRPRQLCCRPAAAGCRRRSSRRAAAEPQPRHGSSSSSSSSCAAATACQCGAGA